MIRKYGWKRPTEASPHPMLRVPQHLVPLPPVVDLSQYDSAIADQGDMGECTGESLRGLCEHLLVRQSRFFGVSPLAIYYWEREIEGTTDQDSGAELADGMTVISHRGIPPLDLWGDIDANLLVAPPDTVTLMASAHRLTDPRSVQQTDYAVRSTLAMGLPVAIGIDVFNQFESEEAAQTGEIDMPGPGESPIGGHAVLVVGYDDRKKRFKIKNSWGYDWAIKGYCTLPYRYVLSSRYCSDLHTGSQIS